MWASFSSRKNTSGYKCIKDFDYDMSKDINVRSDHFMTNVVTTDGIRQDGTKAFSNIINSKLIKDEWGNIRCWHGKEKSQSLGFDHFVKSGSSREVNTEKIQININKNSDYLIFIYT